MVTRDREKGCEREKRNELRFSFYLKKGGTSSGSAAYPGIQICWLRRRKSTRVSVTDRRRVKKAGAQAKDEKKQVE